MKGLTPLGGARTGRSSPLFRVPRKLREEVEGGIYHVFARGDNRRPIYLDDSDRRTYLSLLSRAVRTKNWRCLSYCLMANHVHLMLETPDANLGAGMQQLQSNYAQIFNKRHGGCGHVFQGRYGAVRVRSDEQLWTLVVYVARNPVEAGLCEFPEAWAWGSHRSVVENRYPSWLDVPRLMSHLGGAGGEPRERYAALVSDRADC